MGRRIRWLGVIMVVCFGLVIVQLVNIQLVKAKALPDVAVQPPSRGRNGSTTHVVRSWRPTAPYWPSRCRRRRPTRRTTHTTTYASIPRARSMAASPDTTQSSRGRSRTSRTSTTQTWAAHQSAPQTLSQLLFREQRPTTTDDVTLTVEPSLQQQAWDALIATPNNNDGAVVVLDVKTGAVLAMVSKPNYDPNVLVSTSLSADNFAYYGYTHKDGEGFYPLRPLATGETFFPGSTMKVVTSTAAYNLKPSLAGFTYPTQPCQSFSDSNRLLCNDGSSPSNSTPCGGTMTAMLPASCDPGYGELGIQEGAANVTPAGGAVRNQLAAGDRPSEQYAAAGRRRGGVDARRRCPIDSQALQAYTAIGQDTVADTALQNAMIAAGIANGGVVMTPHLMSSIHDSQGALVETYTPKPMARSASVQAAQSVAALMESVPINGTARGVGFPSYLCAAVKTGTAQTGLGLNHDWMIGFAPANDPKIAVAVVVPYQNISSDGASIAGPIVNKVMQAALPPGSVQQPCNVTAPPLSAYGPQSQAPIYGG